MSRRVNPQQTQADRANRANQLNTNNDAYWQSRGHEERPNDWKSQSGAHQRSARGGKPSAPAKGGKGK